jgi:hypothetical protein
MPVSVCRGWARPYFAGSGSELPVTPHPLPRAPGWARDAPVTSNSVAPFSGLPKGSNQHASMKHPHRMKPPICSMLVSLASSVRPSSAIASAPGISLAPAYERGVGARKSRHYLNIYLSSLLLQCSQLRPHSSYAMSSTETVLNAGIWTVCCWRKGPPRRSSISNRIHQLPPANWLSVLCRDPFQRFLLMNLRLQSSQQYVCKGLRRRRSNGHAA